tara:strand:+ start:427 stop:783 length:357 start_codon:yes stop_codon:yes gene_type:complete
MAAFQNNVVRIATIIFIFFMALTSLMLLLAKQNQKFPPMYPTCPDYYILQDDGGPKCMDDKLLAGSNQNGGTPPMSCGKLNLNHPSYKGWGDAQIKAKRKWAQDCGVTWDGLTNVGKK